MSIQKRQYDDLREALLPQSCLSISECPSSCELLISCSNKEGLYVRCLIARNGRYLLTFKDQSARRTDSVTVAKNTVLEYFGIG